MMATMMTSAATTAIIWFWDICLPHTVAVQLRPSIGKGKGRREVGSLCRGYARLGAAPICNVALHKLLRSLRPPVKPDLSCKCARKVFSVSVSADTRGKEQIKGGSRFGGSR